MEQPIRGNEKYSFRKLLTNALKCCIVVSMIEDTDKARKVIMSILEDFDRNFTTLSSEAARIAITNAIIDQLGDTPVVQ